MHNIHRCYTAVISAVSRLRLLELEKAGWSEKFKKALSASKSGPKASAPFRNWMDAMLKAEGKWATILWLQIYRQELNTALPTGDYGPSAMLYCMVQARDMSAVQCLLAAGVDSTIGNHVQETPLHAAVSVTDASMSLALVRILLDVKVDVNRPNWIGDTALHEAVKSGHDMIVRLLLARNANLNALNSKGQTPLDIARRYGYSKVVKVLVEASPSKERHCLNMSLFCEKAKRVIMAPIEFICLLCVNFDD